MIRYKCDNKDCSHWRRSLYPDNCSGATTIGSCLYSMPIKKSEGNPEITKEEFIDEIDNPYCTQVGGNHYKEDYPFCQPLEFFSKNNISFTKANVCKYVLRHDRKDGIQDLMKAKHYLEVICWDEYGQVL